MATYATFVRHCARSSTRATRQEKENIQTGNEGIKLCLFVDEIILYIHNLKEFLSKTVRTNKFSKVAGYKINIEKFVVFLYHSLLMI